MFFFEEIDSPKVRFENSPLKEVVCKISVDSELFTKLNVARLINALTQEFNSDNKSELKDGEFKFDISDFESIVLGSGYILIGTVNYSLWREFWLHCQKVLSVLANVWGCSSLPSVSLNYINVIEPTLLNIEPDWRSLIRRELLGLSAINNLKVEKLYGEVEVLLGADVGLMIVYGIVTISNETDGFVIQIHLSSVNGRVDFQEVESLLKHYNVWANKVFRWCVLDPLYDAMGPVSIN